MDRSSPFACADCNHLQKSSGSCEKCQSLRVCPRFLVKGIVDGQKLAGILADAITRGEPLNLGGFDLDWHASVDYMLGMVRRERDWKEGEPPKQPEANAPLFGFLADFQAQIRVLEQENQALKAEIETANRIVRTYQNDCAHLRTEITRHEEDRKTEREKLVEWLDRRLKQQEEALALKFISEETKRNVEIEVGLLKRYREIIIENSHTKGMEAWMPKFV